MSWAGNRNVGEGRMTIVESRPDELVRFRLEFFKPFDQGLANLRAQAEAAQPRQG